MVDNAFAAPAHDDDPVYPRQLFPELSFKEVKRLRSRSRNITSFAGLSGLAAVLSGGLALLFAWEGQARIEVPVILFLVALLATVVAVPLYRRHSSGRIAGIVACAFALLVFPPGTIIGLAGLFTFVGSKRLFGPERLRHADLEREYQYRRRHKVA